MEHSHDADVLVCAGDFTIFENDMESILRKLNSIGKPIILIHGNHETSAMILSAITGMPNIHFIHKSHHIIDDVIFFGYGGGGFGHVDPKFDIVSQQFMNELREIERKNNREYQLVLVTHAPPYGTTLDDLGYHVGSKSIRAFIEKEQPLIAISGHIHESAGQQDMIKKSLLINPGPQGKIIEL
jgi:Icc-related predicted phosphoesterase